MRIAVLIPALAVAALTVTLQAGSGGDLGRQVLAANDGWASSGAGTTGGSTAADDQVYVVRTRAELVAALNNGVYPPPSVDAVERAQDHLRQRHHRRQRRRRQPAARLHGLLPRTGSPSRPSSPPTIRRPWGRVNPTGDLETARVASRRGAAGARPDPRRLQHHHRRARRRCDAPRGVARHPRHSTAGGNPTNIIIRNITFLDTYDCFPQWSPTDGAPGQLERGLRQHLAARRRSHLDRPQPVR